LRKWGKNLVENFFSPKHKFSPKMFHEIHLKTYLLTKDYPLKILAGHKHSSLFRQRRRKSFDNSGTRAEIGRKVNNPIEVTLQVLGKLRPPMVNVIKLCSSALAKRATKLERFSLASLSSLSPVLQKFYNYKFTIVNCASVWSITYDRNLQSYLRLITIII
jgi:hypothetical protein